MTRPVVDRAGLAMAFEQGAGYHACHETLGSLQRRLAAFEPTTAIIEAFLAGILDRPNLDAEARAAIEGAR